MSLRTSNAGAALLALALAGQACRDKPVEVAEPAATSRQLTSPERTTPLLAAPPASVASVPSTVTGLHAQLHLPSHSSSAKTPLLIMLHALGSSSEAIERFSDWPAFAELSGIAWAAPNGPFDRRGRRFWDAGPSCCNFDQLPVDHVAALEELIQRLASNPRIDKARIYVGGHSNGGFMAHRLACERPELLAGIVSVAGSAPLDTSRCQSPKALRVLQVQGDADPIVAFGGGHLFQDSRLPQHASAQQTLRDWARRLGCAGQSKPFESLDFEASLPGAETRATGYAACPRGAVVLWTVGGGGHLIGFRSPAPSAIWSALTR